MAGIKSGDTAPPYGYRPECGGNSAKSATIRSGRQGCLAEGALLIDERGAHAKGLVLMQLKAWLATNRIDEREPDQLLGFGEVFQARARNSRPPRPRITSG